ncbi:MAG: NUDIX domain-containing protein [Parachlamydiaceae bacterium]|nr:NUDIX domain-containing protein [Parachlamydiaceae bacterium]
MERQYTATAYIISQERTLLIYHRKLQKWLPPGGHIDANELPSEAAKREVVEETGLEVELFTDEHIWVERLNANSLPRPYMCLLEEIPAHGIQVAHQHIDFIYLARPIGGEEKVNETETVGMRWFTLEEVELLIDDIEVFSETKETIHSIFEKLNYAEDFCLRQHSNNFSKTKTRI